MNEDEFNKVQGTKPRGIYDSYKTYFKELQDKARNTISELPQFSFELFEQEHFTNRDKNDLFAQMEAAAKRLRAEGRISTAVSFECGIKSLKQFIGKDKLPFKAVNVPFLKKYEKWMIEEKSNTYTTVGIYIRNVRTMFNEVKIKGLVYPFGRSKNGLYQIPKGRNIKKALTQKQVSTIAEFQCIGNFETRSRDLWLFSYLANGINVKDIARLKYSDIVTDSDGARIQLIRAKTAASVEERQHIEIIITRQLGRIIDKWGSKPPEPDNFIFPILTKGMTPADEYRAIQQAVQTINKNMKRICADLNIDPVTTYTARHSFATVLKRSGASVEFISESLGHKSKDTTTSYLATFEDTEKRKWADILLPEKE
jgi:integrase